jgi:hypothetical protein
MAIIKDLAKTAHRCEVCGNSNIMYFLIKDNARGKYHFHYLYDFTSPRITAIPHPKEQDIVEIICEEFDVKDKIVKGTPFEYELVAFYCWGCATKGINRYAILTKFQDNLMESCHYCNKNTYFIKEKHLGMTKGLSNIKGRNQR